MLTKSATLMPAADLPPSEARGRYRGLLTKSKRAGTRQKRKSKIWRVRSNPNRAQVHARKEKARLGVCGAIPAGHRHTPEKKKQDLACAEHPPTGHKYTPEKKKQDLTCAEPSQQGTSTRQKRKSKIWRVRSTPNKAHAHARKEKARFGVCGAITDAFPQITR